MSFDAIRWAMEQPVRPALTKFVLVAMADCANSDGAEAVCWPSYAHLCRRTGMNTKTVEQAVFHLKESGYIVDTGRRAGATGKVVVFRLNTTAFGGIQTGPQTPSASGTRPHNDTENGGVTDAGTGAVIPPNPACNPPKFNSQSPQILEVIPPKTGDVISKDPKKRTKKEPGIQVAAVPGVAPNLFADWLAVRKDKKAGTLTGTAVQGLIREAGKAGLTNEEAVRYCVEANWIGFNAGHYLKRESGAGGRPAETPYQASQRQRVAEFAPGVAKRPAHQIDAETFDVPSLTSR